MAKAQLSGSVLETLSKQLNNIKEDKKKIIKQSLPYVSDNGYEFTKLLDSYEGKLTELVGSSDHNETTIHSIPFVTIGSEVEVYDLESQETITYNIVSLTVFELEGNDVTYLSPIGKGLLMKEVNDIAQFNTPGGVIRYEIKSIRLQPTNKNDI